MAGKGGNMFNMENLKKFWKSSGLQEIFEILLGPFEGRRRQSYTAYSYFILAGTAIFAMLGYVELFSAYFPQFYDKVQLPQFGWKTFFISLGYVIAFFVFGYALSMIGEYFSNKLPKNKANGTAIFKFIVFIILLGTITFFLATKWGFPHNFSTGYRMMFSQLSMLIAGIAIFVYVSDLNLRRLQNLPAKTVLYLCIACLVVQILPVFGESAKGATRKLCGIQVCDFLVPMFVFGCAWLSARPVLDKGFIRYIKEKKQLKIGLNGIIFLFMFIVLIILWLCQGNLSTGAVYAAMLFFIAWNCNLIDFPEIQRNKYPKNDGGSRLKHWLVCIKCFFKNFFIFIYNGMFSPNKKLLPVLSSAFIIFAALMFYIDVPQKLARSFQGINIVSSESFRWERFTNWVLFDADIRLDIPFGSQSIDFARHKANKGGQGYYSKLAIMKGGANGSMKSNAGVVFPAIGGCEVSNKRLLSEAWSDFIFAVVCSEWGFWKMLFFPDNPCLCSAGLLPRNVCIR